MSAPERMDRFYRGVRAVARFWLWFFFKAVDVRRPERVPREGPVLLCINHPNNFIDSFVVGAAVRRKVHYLATAALFRNPLVARFLLAAGAIAVWRKQDERTQASTDKNAETFAACAAAFEHGALIAIYPEGTTHAEARVRRLKTGAARIALAWEAAHPRTLAMVPVGLTFEARKSFRARVLVSFGAQLLQAIELLYRDVLARAVMDARGVGPRGVDRVRLSRSIVEAIGWFKAREPARVEAIWQRIRTYRALLAQYHLRDETVRARLERLPARHRIIYSWDAVVGFPFFLYGTLVNLLPYLVPRWLAQHMARKETDYATVRLLASIVAFPVFWGLQTWLVRSTAGGLVAALFALSLPLSGLIAYRYLAGAGRFGSRLRFAVLTATLHLGSFTFDSVGTVAVRQRVVRDALVDYGAAFARAGFRHILIANGHAGPGHLAALEEAAALVSRRHRVIMASFTGHLAWEFMRGRYAAKIEARLGRAMSDEERRAFAEDAHGGWWETSLMLLLRPDLVDGAYRTLPAARYSWPERVVPNYAVRKGGRGYVGHPALADPAFARATTDVLMTEAMAIVDGLLDGTHAPGRHRSVFSRVPVFRTNFWPAAAGVAAGLGALAVGVVG